MREIDFHRSTLFISARSPFARRVRVALHEHQIPFEEKVLDVWKPVPELLKYNPLGRVPALVLQSGEVLVDSDQILQTLYRYIKSPFQPGTSEDFITCQFWSATACGVAEKCVEYFMEHLRPEAHRDPEIIDEIGGIIGRVLDQFEAFIGDRETVVPGLLTQTDFDLGIMLAYISLRYSNRWLETHPNAARYFRKIDQRPSFVATRPPAA